MPEREPIEVQILQARLRALEETGQESADALRARLAAARRESRYLLFVPGAAGYELTEGSGAPPEPGSAVSVGGRGFVVLKLGPSPLPGDRRRCAYLA